MIYNESDPVEEDETNDAVTMDIGAITLEEDWSDEYDLCGRPCLLHKDRPCTRTERESPEVIFELELEF